MTVVESGELIAYEAFSVEERPPAFAVRAPGEAIAFPYAQLVGVGWMGSDAKDVLLVEHHFFNVYLHGDNLEPLLEALRRYTVGDIHVFDSERHAPVTAGRTVITHISDHYVNEKGETVKLPLRRGKSARRDEK
jgi:hypothetical protein